MKTIWMATVLVMFLGVNVSHASIDVYEFNNPEKEAQFRTLATELRCPKCQNQNVNDSNAPLAKDIKDRVFQMVNDGKSNDEIVDFMVERYGEFVTYRPRLSIGVALLWGLPAALGLLVLTAVLVSRRSASKPAAAMVDQQKIQSLLKQYGAGDSSLSGERESAGNVSKTSSSENSKR